MTKIDTSDEAVERLAAECLEDAGQAASLHFSGHAKWLEEVAATLRALLSERRETGSRARGEALAAACKAVCEGCRLSGSRLDEHQCHGEPQPIRCEALAIRALKSHPITSETQENAHDK